MNMKTRIFWCTNSDNFFPLSSGRNCTDYGILCLWFSNLIIPKVYQYCRYNKKHYILTFWISRISNQSILKKSTPNIHWKDRCWIWSSNILATWSKEPIHCKRPWCWERLRAGGEEGIRGWDSCMAPSMQWTWVWANSGREWRTGKPAVLQSMRLQKTGHDLATEQQQIYWL